MLENCRLRCSAGKNPPFPVGDANEPNLLPFLGDIELLVL